MEKFSIVKILVYPKINKNHFQGLKNLRKTIFNILEANLDENLIKKTKKSQIYPQNQKFPIFSKFKISLVARNGRPAKNRLEGAV